MKTSHKQPRLHAIEELRDELLYVKLKSYPSRELLQLLRKNGWEIKNQEGSHVTKKAAAIAAAFSLAGDGHVPWLYPLWKQPLTTSLR